VSSIEVACVTRCLPDALDDFLVALHHISSLHLHHDRTSETDHLLTEPPHITSEEESPKEVFRFLVPPLTTVLSNRVVDRCKPLPPPLETKSLVIQEKKSTELTENSLASKSEDEDGSKVKGLVRMSSSFYLDEKIEQKQGENNTTSAVSTQQSSEQQQRTIHPKSPHRHIVYEEKERETIGETLKTMLGWIFVYGPKRSGKTLKVLDCLHDRRVYTTRDVVYMDFTKVTEKSLFHVSLFLFLLFIYLFSCTFIYTHLCLSFIFYLSIYL
jgi:hypothetical protein